MSLFSEQLSSSDTGGVNGSTYAGKLSESLTARSVVWILRADNILEGRCGRRKMRFPSGKKKAKRRLLGGGGEGRYGKYQRRGRRQLERII
jgi:hypothetical protein